MAEARAKTDSKTDTLYRFVCVHCGHRFEDADKNPDRCPSCLRKTGVELIGEAKGGERPRWLVPGVAALVVAAVAGGYFFWAKSVPSPVGDEVPLEPLETSVLRGHLRRLNVEAGDDLTRFMAPTDRVEAWADEVFRDASSPTDKTKALTDAIAQRVSSGRLEAWSRSRPRRTPVVSASDLVTQLEQGEGHRLYPLEVAALSVAALRSHGVDAMVAEIYRLPEVGTPPDPTGDVGYFVVALPRGDAAGDGSADRNSWTLVDVYGGHDLSELGEDNLRVLDDVNVHGAVLNHWARHTFAHEGDFEEAFDRIESALRLDRRSAAIRSARADILLVTGGAQQALDEYEAAAQLRPDGPRRLSLAALLVESREYEDASREVAAALEQFPDYAGGHAMLAAISLARTETSDALRSLERAQELDSELPQLPLLWAQYHYFGDHDETRAAAKAHEAIDARPYDMATAIAAAQIFRLTAHYDEMRAQARRVLELAPPSQREMYEQLLPRILGPTALEEPLDSEPALEPSDDDEDADQGFQLDMDTLGHDRSGVGSSLGLEERESSGGPTLRLGDPDDLSLGAGELMLDLDP